MSQQVANDYSYQPQSMPLGMPRNRIPNQVVRTDSVVVPNVQNEEVEEQEDEVSRRLRLAARLDSLDESAIADPINLYLDEISHISLLNRDSETLLAKQMEDGAQAEKKLKHKDLTTEEVRYFKRLVKRGQKARNQLIQANYRLVISISKKYNSCGVSFMDLVQEGNIGLIKAVDKFDYRRGYKFSTYATWWIRQAVTRAIADQGRTIRVPVHMCERINKLARVTRELSKELAREPTCDEIAKQMETTSDHVEQIRRIALHPLSLETPVGEENDSNLGDFIEDDAKPRLAELIADDTLRDRLEDVLSTLSAREHKIIRLRFGLQDGRIHTLEEVGQKFGVTRERIRQIESVALRKLRHPRRSRWLKDFLE